MNYCFVMQRYLFFSREQSLYIIFTIINGSRGGVGKQSTIFAMHNLPCQAWFTQTLFDQY